MLWGVMKFYGLFHNSQAIRGMGEKREIDLVQVLNTESLIILLYW